jgi:hypothetical protein
MSVFGRNPRDRPGDARLRLFVPRERPKISLVGAAICNLLVFAWGALRSIVARPRCGLAIARLPTQYCP